MKQMSKKLSMAMVSLTLLVGLSISGCASSKSGWQNMGVSKPKKRIFSRYDSGVPPDDNALKTDLPEITSEELEALGDRYFSSKDYYMAFVQYEKALEQNPDNTRIHLKQGLLFLCGVCGLV